MSIIRNRFQLALTQVRSAQWEEFEHLSSAFLAAEFPGARTMASPGGDRGRDAELYSSSGVPNVLFQFSVRSDWRAKIRETLSRIGKEFPGATHVVFMTSQEIGAVGDAYKADAVKIGKSLDIRDRSWFLDRINLDDARKNAAAQFSATIVDPFLAESGIITTHSGLNGQQARTALIYLEMQSRDDDTGKGLTKLSFEALVRCSLRGTSAERRKTRVEVYRDINDLLPQHAATQLKPFIDSALLRLNKKTIKHHSSDDSFHVSFEEIESTKDRVAGLALLDAAFVSDIEEMLRSDSGVPPGLYGEVVAKVRQIVEIYFYRLGEEFAQSVTKNSSPPMHSDLINNICMEVAPLGSIYRGTRWVDYLQKLSFEVLNTPSDATNELLRLLSTSYTLFAFLSAVPDVQKATKKLFERGVIWVDTSVVLPILAEQAFDDDMRPFTDLMVNLARAGTKVVVTEGVLEEVERHLNLCRTYLRSSEWRGRVPYIFSRYIESGRTPAKFASWLEIFVGDHRPLDDLADFLFEVAKIDVEKPPVIEGISDHAVRTIREYWQRVQESRRAEEGFSNTVFRLAEHDSENYIAALVQRSKTPATSVLGYSSWYLTMDSAAWYLFDQINREVQQEIKHAPVISLDFLLKYLAFGPRRDMVDTSGKGFSRIFTASVYESIPVELVAVAEQVREKNAGVAERIVQRRIRDELDRQKMAAGVAQRAGLLDATDKFRGTL